MKKNVLRKNREIAWEKISFEIKKITIKEYWAWIKKTESFSKPKLKTSIFTTLIKDI